MCAECTSATNCIACAYPESTTAGTEDPAGTDPSSNTSSSYEIVGYYNNGDGTCMECSPMCVFCESL